MAELDQLAEELEDEDDGQLKEPTIRHTQEEWDEIEANDDYLIEAGDISTEISFFASGKPYLSINAVMRLANSMNLDIQSCDIEETDRKTYRGKALAISPRGLKRWGFHEEAVNPSQHSYSKTGNKAQRNAFRNFIYGHKNADAAIKHFLEANTSGDNQQSSNQSYQQPPTQQQQATQPPAQQQEEQAQQPTELDIARSRAILAAKALMPDFETKYGITEIMFWERVKVRYGRTESKYFTKENWDDLHEQIHMDPIPDWLNTPVPSETEQEAAG